MAARKNRPGKYDGSTKSVVVAVLKPSDLAKRPVAPRTVSPRVVAYTSESR